MIYPTSILSLETWILLGTVILLIRYYLHRKWQYLSNLNIPHDPPSILKLGNLRTMLDQTKIWTYDNEMKKKHGPVWGLYFGLSPHITVHDPDMLRKIMVKEFATFPCRQKGKSTIHGKEFGMTVANVAGKTWKRQRATLSPSFTTGKLKEMSQIIDRCTDCMIEALDKKCEGEGGAFAAYDLFSRLSLDIICSAAFSTNVHSQDTDKEEPKVATMAKKLFDVKINPLIILLVIFPRIESVYAKLGVKIFAGDSFAYFKDLSNEVIRRHRENPTVQRRVDLMTLMLDAEIKDEELKNEPEKGLIHDEIVGNSAAFILAGYLNVVSAMVFLSYNLAQHEDVQRKLQEKIDDVIKERGKLDYDGMNSIKYLDMCINESLRLYCPISRNMRICEKEITINGLTIPEGASIHVPVFALCRDPEFWDEPLKFKPERMEDMTHIDNMVFQPFGGGPRNCIGLRFAYLELKMAFCKLLQKYSLLPCDDTPKPPLKLRATSAVAPAEDFQLRVRLREE